MKPGYRTLASWFVLVCAATIAPGCRKDRGDPSDAVYRAAGCDKIHPLPPLPTVAEWGSIKGVVCEIGDAATRVPDCDGVAAIYRRESRPTGVYGVIVNRHSKESAECQGAYDANGAMISDLPAVDRPARPAPDWQRWCSRRCGDFDSGKKEGPSRTVLGASPVLKREVTP